MFPLAMFPLRMFLLRLFRSYVCASRRVDTRTWCAFAGSNGCGRVEAFLGFLAFLEYAVADPVAEAAERVVEDAHCGLGVWVWVKLE